MASYADTRAGRDAADFDNERKDGKFHGAFGLGGSVREEASDFSLSPDAQKAVDEALAQIERCFPRRPQAQRVAA